MILKKKPVTHHRTNDEYTISNYGFKRKLCNSGIGSGIPHYKMFVKKYTYYISTESTYSICMVIFCYRDLWLGLGLYGRKIRNSFRKQQAYIICEAFQQIVMEKCHVISSPNSPNHQCMITVGMLRLLPYAAYYPECNKNIYGCG